MIMPFGKYVGQKLDDIPSDYLQWALETCTLNAALATEMENQLIAREGQGIPRAKGWRGDE